MALWFQNSGHQSPLEWYFNGVQTLASLILHIAIALSVKNCKILASKATGMIFQLGSSTGIANFAHCYCLISSKLQNSGPQSPLEWYFNGVQTLASLILHVAIAVWVKKCKIPPTIAPWKDISMGSNTGIANSSHYHCLISSKLQNSSPHCPLIKYFNGGQTLALLILQIAITLWVQHCKIPATIAHWNDISMGSRHWHCQFFTFLWHYEFKVAKFRSP